ncbi:hypothetical protein NON20_25295 (plasmid) [Synechocystis sp. B12]|nr:hypothetical protein NON20_25295 [Synechocystis sp. B12]
MASLVEIKEDLYAQLQGINVADKHGRDMEIQHYQQLHKCIELIEELETELVKCELMKGQTFEGVYKETLERPGEV